MDITTRKPPESVALGRGVSRWQEAVSKAYFPLDTDCADRDMFRGALDIWPLGPLSVTRIRCDGVLYSRRNQHLKDERESAILISIPSHSRVTFRQFDRQTHCQPGGFVIERSDAPYEYWHNDQDTQWVIKLPMDSIRARIGDLERFFALSIDARQGMASYFMAGLRNAIAHLDAMDGAARQTTGQHLLDVLCLALRTDERVITSEASTIQAAHLDRAQDFIRRNIKRHALSPKEVADYCGISLRYLQRLFAAQGCSVGEHIRACRLARAHEDILSGSRETLAQTAHRWGFYDQSQFSRHYRDRYGHPPSLARGKA